MGDTHFSGPLYVAGEEIVNENGEVVADIEFDASGGITDSNGNELLDFTVTTAAINNIDIGNAAIGDSPAITAIGDDTNIGINLTPKGSEGVHVNAGPQSGLEVYVEDDGASGGGIVMNLDSASPAADDNLGNIVFVGNDDGGNETQYAVIQGFIADPTDGSEEGALVYNVMNGSGTLEEVCSIESNGVGLAKILYLSTEVLAATSEGVAASIATIVSKITTNGDTDEDAVTLADGDEDGQIKKFIVSVVGNAADSVKITPAKMIGGTQITFAANPLGKGCEMIWDEAADGWVVCANNGGTIA